MKMRDLMCMVLSTALVSSVGVVNAATSGQDLATLKTYYEQHSENVDAAYEYAIALARNENFGTSLPILQRLHAEQPGNMAILADYIIVLNWSGNNRTAIDLYEQKAAAANPSDYLKVSIAGAYYQAADFKTAQYLFHQVAASGDRKAKIWEAQSLMRLGDKTNAQKLYEELLAKNNKDIEVYLSRGAMLMLAKESTAAIKDFEYALQLTPAGEEGVNARRLIHRDMASAYIRNGEETKAIVLVKSYIDDGTADVFMQGDYILALRLNRDYKTAISEGTRLWKNYKTVPVFGLQALADSYARTGQMSQAIAIYQQILQRDTNQAAVKLGLAFSQVMSGQVGAGLKTYEQLIAEDATLAAIAMDDAFFFMETGRYLAGEKLYSHIVNKFPENAVFRQEFAGALTNNVMPRQAYDQYKALYKLTPGEAEGPAGMASSAVAVGDYQRAKAMIGVLNEQHSRNVLSLQANKDYERRPMGNLGFGFSFSKDYKGNQSVAWQSSSAQNIGGSFSLLGEMGHITLKDRGVSPTKSEVLKNRSVGLQYRGIRNDVQAWYDDYRNNGSFSGYRVFTNHYVNDQVAIGADVWRAPLNDVQALNPALVPLPDGRIMTTNYRIRADIQDGTTNSYSLAYTRGLYSDNNQVNTYDVSWNRTLKFTDKVNLFWYTFYGQSSYKLQRDAIYESPTRRETIGTGITKRWITKNTEVPTGLVNSYGIQQTTPSEYFEGAATLELGRDRPDPIDFAPHFRFEYGRAVTPNQTFIIGTEYGLRTDRINNNKDLNFGYRQYDVVYRFVW